MFLQTEVNFMKKRIVSLMMTGILALSLAACGGTGAAKPAEEAPAQETQEEQTEEAAEEKEETADTETPEVETAEAETTEEAEASEEEDSVEKLVADVISLEKGTAGSQLKAVGLAARFIRLYADGQTDITDVEKVTEGLSPEDREQFTDNFVDIIWPYLQEALNGDEMIGGILEDLGLSDEIDQIVQENLTEDDIKVFTEFADALREE
jgi:predicted small lipoprotein YifL